MKKNKNRCSGLYKKWTLTVALLCFLHFTGWSQKQTKTSSVQLESWSIPENVDVYQDYVDTLKLELKNNGNKNLTLKEAKFKIKGRWRLEYADVGASGQGSSLKYTISLESDRIYGKPGIDKESYLKKLALTETLSPKNNHTILITIDPSQRGEFYLFDLTLYFNEGQPIVIKDITHYSTDTDEMRLPKTKEDFLAYIKKINYEMNEAQREIWLKYFNKNESVTLNREITQDLLKTVPAEKISPKAKRVIGYYN